jgi:hypothetical protein
MFAVPFEAVVGVSDIVVEGKMNNVIWIPEAVAWCRRRYGLFCRSTSSFSVVTFQACSEVVPWCSPRSASFSQHFQYAGVLAAFDGTLPRSWYVVIVLQLVDIFRTLSGPDMASKPSVSHGFATWLLVMGDSCDSFVSQN